MRYLVLSAAKPSSSGHPFLNPRVTFSLALARAGHVAVIARSAVFSGTSTVTKPSTTVAAWVPTVTAGVPAPRNRNRSVVPVTVPAWVML